MWRLFEQRRWLCVLICCAVTGSSAGAWHLFGPLRRGLVSSLSPDVNRTPNYLSIDILLPSGETLRSLTIRDKESIAAVVSLLDQSERAPLNFARERCAGIVVPPREAKSYSRSPYPVWKFGDEKFAWSDGENEWMLGGDLDAVLDSLKARRIAQYLTASTAKERNEGIELREIYIPELRPQIEKLAGSSNEQLAQFGTGILKDLDLQLDPLPVEDDPRPAHARPEKPVNELLSTLRESLTDLKRDSSDPHALANLVEACQQLGAHGPSEAAGPLAQLLREAPEGHSTHYLMEAVEGAFGLPPSYQRLGICGNSSREELEAAAVEGNRRLAAGRQKGLKWIDDNADKAAQEQLLAVLAAWQPTLMRLTGPEAHTRYASTDRDPARALRPLLLRPDLVPSLRLAQARTQQLSEQGMLEYVAASVSGECDIELVDQLLDGDMHQQIVACQIISVARQTDREHWQPTLVSFLKAPIYQTKRQEVLNEAGFVLRDAATTALFECQGVQILPTLEETCRLYFDNGVSSQLINRYLTPEWPVAE